MEKSFYPKIDVRDVVVKDGDAEYNAFALSTTLRKEHNGKWYMWNFFKNWRLPVNDEKAKLNAIDVFHHEVYHTIILGIISENSTDIYEQPILKEDTDQRSESERVKALLRF
jgi:hypothetical protein